MGIQLSIHFQKKFSSGLFDGEGFIMQKLSENGMVFLEIDGFVKEQELSAGQSIIVDTGNLAAMSSTCQMEIQQVHGLKNKFFGGERFFNTIIHVPGKVWLQTMPISSVANSIKLYIITN